MSETWRVIDQNGTEHPVTVEVRDSDVAAAIVVSIGGKSNDYHRDTNVRAAIAHRALAADIAVVEILAPGQPSRDLTAARAYADGAEATRNAAALTIRERLEDHVEKLRRLDCDMEAIRRHGDEEALRELWIIIDELRSRASEASFINESVIDLSAKR